MNAHWVLCYRWEEFFQKCTRWLWFEKRFSFSCKSPQHLKTAFAMFASSNRCGIVWCVPAWTSACVLLP